MIKFDFITIFPEIINPYFEESLFKKARAKKLLSVHVHNLRDFAEDKHCTVDDKPFGGGLGMVMSVQPWYKAVKKIRKLTDKTLIAKLSPNVTDICEIGIAAEKAGADILCAGNTFKGVYYDWQLERFYTGGVSGSMIFPMACKNVFELYKKVSIPIIGLGGINSEKKAIEMVFAGASIVGLGTHLVIMPDLPAKIYRFFIEYLKQSKKSKISSIVGIKNEKE